MKLRPQFATMQQRIAFLFSTIILFIIVTGAVLSYRFSFFAMRTNSLAYTYQLMQQVASDIDSYVKYMQDISQMITYNKDVHSFLSEEDTVTPQQVYLKTRIEEQLNAITLARNDVSYFAILGTDNRFVFNKPDMMPNPYVDPKKQSWYVEALLANGQPVISPSHVQNIVKDDYKYVVSLSRTIQNPTTKANLGVILVDLNFSRIKDLCSNVSLGKRGYLFIVDANGDIVYHPQQQLIYSHLKHEYIQEVLQTTEGTFTIEDGANSRMYTVKNAAYANWKVVGVTYIDELVQAGSNMQASYIVVAAFSLTVALLLSYYLAALISKPIKRLESAMKEMGKGNFDISAKPYTKDEIGQFAFNFDTMSQRIKELMHQSQVDYDLKRKYELKALQDQINPHFLYNTLDSIVWMAEMGNSEEVVLMTSSLAKLFRVTLSRGTELITIAQEITHVKSYLTIQQMRYKDKIAFKLDVDPHILHLLTLKLLLQPLVENAIYHGLKNKNGAGTITVKGFTSHNDQKVVLQVTDTGMGMTHEQLLSIFAKENHKGTGIGITNVNQRIQLYFGMDYGLYFTSKPGVGTTATIIIPAQTAQEEGGNKP